MKRVPISLAILIALSASSRSPAGFAGESTLEFLTVGPEEGVHGSTV